MGDIFLVLYDFNAEEEGELTVSAGRKVRQVSVQNGRDVVENAGKPILRFSF